MSVVDTTTSDDFAREASVIAPKPAGPSMEEQLVHDLLAAQEREATPARQPVVALDMEYVREELLERLRRPSQEGLDLNKDVIA